MTDQFRNRILYIDDDATAAKLFKTTMEQEGYSVDLVPSGADGLALFLADPYPLVVADHHLDGMTGLEVCRELEKHISEPVLILVTGKGDEDVVIEAQILGVQRCIPKIDETIYTDVFPTVIIRLLRRREAARRTSAVEAELRQSEERFAQAETLSHSCHWESDQTLKHWTFASANTEQLLGVPMEDTLGSYENFIRYIHPDDQDNVRETYTAAVRDHGPYEAHYRFCRPDGNIIHLNEIAVPMFDENGGILYYRGSTQDITPQVDTEERFRAVVEGAVEAIITIDSGGVIQSFNRAAETLFDYPRSEVIGLNVKILMPPEHAEMHDGYLSDYLTTRKARIIGIGRDVVAQRKDGTTFPAFLSVSQHEVGGKISFTGLLRDVSDQKSAEASLIAAKNEAERANRAKSEFLSSMSHELRTPLNAILGFAQMLEYNPQEPLSPTQQESVDLIKRGGGHLLVLINEVLELSKIEAGHIDLSIETIDVSNTIEECATIARATATDRGIELTYASVGAPLPHIEADNTRLKQVLLNLLSNAVKYNRDAGSITVDAVETDDDFIRISVADTGIGLSEREKRKVFEPFERLGKQSESIEGTGIGLTITKQLIEMMNGRLGFESEVGKGSTFWIELPKSHYIAGQHDDHFPDDIRVEISGPIADPESSYNVLCVEDNETNARLIMRVFDAIPNAILNVVGSARGGIQYAKKHKPDLILMDINLPDMSGMEAAKILQRNAETNHIPIIAVTASVWRDKKGLAEDVDFYEYVEKPFDIIKIHEIIQSALIDGSA